MKYAQGFFFIVLSFIVHVDASASQIFDERDSCSYISLEGFAQLSESQKMTYDFGRNMAAVHKKRAENLKNHIREIEAEESSTEKDDFFVQPILSEMRRKKSLAHACYFCIEQKLKKSKPQRVMQKKRVMWRKK